MMQVFDVFLMCNIVLPAVVSCIIYLYIFGKTDIFFHRFVMYKNNGGVFKKNLTMVRHRNYLMRWVCVLSISVFVFIYWLVVVNNVWEVRLGIQAFDGVWYKVDVLYRIHIILFSFGILSGLVLFRYKLDIFTRIFRSINLYISVFLFMQIVSVLFGVLVAQHESMYVLVSTGIAAFGTTLCIGFLTGFSGGMFGYTWIPFSGHKPTKYQL